MNTPGGGALAPGCARGGSNTTFLCVACLHGTAMPRPELQSWKPRMANATGDASPRLVPLVLIVGGHVTRHGAKQARKIAVAQEELT